MNSLRKLEWLGKVLVALPNYYHDICKNYKDINDFPQWLWHCHDDNKQLVREEFNLGNHSPTNVCKKLLEGSIKFPDYVVLHVNKNFEEKALPERKRNGSPTKKKSKSNKKRKDNSKMPPFEDVVKTTKQSCQDCLAWLDEHLDEKQSHQLDLSISNISESVAQSLHGKQDKGSVNETDDEESRNSSD